MTTEKRELLVAMLAATSDSWSGFEVNDRDHAIQAATRASRAGADDELVVAALLHDAAKSVDPVNHGRLIAGLLAPHVRPEVTWVLRVHQDYTASHLDNGRGAWRRALHSRRSGHALAQRFVDEWDAPARDPGYDTLPLEHFLPVVDRVLAQQLPIARPLIPRLRRRARRLISSMRGRE